MVTAGVGRRGADDAALPRDDVFGLHRMALLLPGVMVSLFRIRAGTLDRLLGAIDDQGLGFLTADFGLSLNTDQRPREPFDPLDRAADRALVDVVKEAQELLGDVTTIIDQHDQKVIVQTANVPGAAGFGLAELSLLPGARELFQHAVERGDADPGQADEACAGAQPGGGERTGHRVGTFMKKVLDESKRPVTCQAQIRRPRSATDGRERVHFRNGSNLSTHTTGALYETFAAPEAHRILQRLEFHYTPKHASWLNMVEIEIGVLRGQCLDRRIGERQVLVSEIDAWRRQRNAAGARIKWKFTTQKARNKLGRAYPDIKES